jgi:predicted Zn finger-like uncharacterized protein
MSDRCPACHALVDDPTVPAGGLLRCGRCNTRFQKPKGAPVATAGRDPNDLGIHPALAKRYAIPQAPNPAPPNVDTNGTGTEPGRPAARRSMEGARVATPAQPVPAQPVAVVPPAPLPDDVMPIIPGYRVLEMIGKGAMGRVYRAQQLSSGRMAAIKTLAPELATRADFVARFEREGAAMRVIKHPGVVTVWDQGAAGNDVYYIAMEFIEGPPLRRSMERGPLALAHALRFTRSVLQALAAAHGPGVVHRDLKPENILVQGQPGLERLVVVDFGLAGMTEEELDPHPNLTKSRMTMGTVNYMAPEQRTDAKRVDHRADLYSAGVMLYEMLTGDLPLGRFALPTERGLKVPAVIDRIIVKALARNADERYQHALHFDADLAAVEQELRKLAMHEVPPAARHETMMAVAAPMNSMTTTSAPTDALPLKPLRRSSEERPATNIAVASMAPMLSGPPTRIDVAPVASAVSSMSLPPGSLVPALSGAPSMVSLVAGPAWATMLPVIKPRTLWSASALLVGLFLGLLVLRSGLFG